MYFLGLKQPCATAPLLRARFHCANFCENKTHGIDIDLIIVDRCCAFHIFPLSTGSWQKANLLSQKIQSTTCHTLAQLAKVGAVDTSDTADVSWNFKQGWRGSAMVTPWRHNFLGHQWKRDMAWRSMQKPPEILNVPKHMTRCQKKQSFLVSPKCNGLSCPQKGSLRHFYGPQIGSSALDVSETFQTSFALVAFLEALLLCGRCPF